MSVENARILVVDDNPATRYSTSRILRSAGWKVEEAETGEQALDMAKEAIDLVVLDVNLPDIDGFEVCRRIREDKAIARIPVLHLSATFVQTIHKVHGLEAGADGYLTHPVEPPVLIATVNAFLRARAAEIASRESEARFKAVFDNALNGVAVLDEQCRFLDINPAMAAILDRPRTAILGTPLFDLVPDNRREEVRRIVQRIDQARAWRGEFPLLASSGDLVHLEWHMSAQDAPGLRLAIVSDISDRKRYEEERESLLQSERGARTEAERANRLKDDFLATLSHELRTPLNAIVGWSQLLNMGGLDAESVREGLETIERNALAQAQMIADLLDVSRITSGKIRLDVQTLHPSETVENAISAVLPAADAKGIRIFRTLDHAGPVSGDPSRLQQVFWNLLNNAVKFTPKNGRIHVTLQRINSHIEIRVSDNGQGIDPTLLSQIFERFRQGDASTTREHGGLGLGLAIAKQLVEMHGGTVRAESAGLGQGSAFIVVLPIMPVQTEQAPAHPSATSATEHASTEVALSGVRVLIVEDDADSRALLKRIVASAGAETNEAGSAEQALDLIPTFEPHVLISDLGMPGRDGFDLIRDVRARGHSFQDLPAVALTAFARAEDRRRTLLAGFQLHLSKPVDPMELTAAIASLVGRTGLRRE